MPGFGARDARARISAMLLCPLALSSCGRLGFELLSEDPGNGAGGTAGLGGDGGSLDAATGGSGNSTPDASFDASAEAGPSCASQPISDPCTELPELTGPAVIDGQLDCGLELRTLVPQGWTQPAPPDATAEYAVAWGPSGLYFYVAVTDPAIIPPDPADPIWYGDGVELYVDADGSSLDGGAYDDPGTRQFTITGPDGITPVRGGVWHDFLPTEVWTSTLFEAHQTAGGYVAEAFIVAADLALGSFDLAAGQQVGFDIGVNVSMASGEPRGSNGYRLDQYFLRVTGGFEGTPYFTQDAFCTPTLVAR